MITKIKTSADGADECRKRSTAGTIMVPAGVSGEAQRV
jgi:hypothetical protein